MTADLREGLEAVVGLAEKATAGPWIASDERTYYDGHLWDVLTADQEHAIGCGYAGPDNGDNNAKFIAACVNLIRQHGPALLALARDGERYRALAELAERSGPVAMDALTDAAFQAFGANKATFDAAIDAALSQPGAEAE